VIRLPKVKPDNVVRHELVLGRAERELLDTAVTAIAANRVLTPLVALLSDVSALTAIFILLEATGLIDLIPDGIRQGIESGVFDSIEKAEEAWDSTQRLKEEIENTARVAAGLAPISPLPMPPGVRLGLAILVMKKQLS
jgi:hypothetical protein